MADQPHEFQAERDASELVEAYREALQTIAARVIAAVASGDLQTARRRRVQLAAVLAVLDQLGARTDPVARRLVEAAYDESVKLTAIEAKGIGHVVSERSFNSVSVESVKALQDSLTGTLDDARRTIGRQVQDVYAREQRRAAARSLLGADGSPRSAAAGLQRDLLRDREVRRMVEDSGIGFRDSAGRGWKLETYAEMATRTVIREAVTAGAVNRMSAHGVNLARVRTEGDACPICTPWAGRLVSLDGETTSFQGEAVATLGAMPRGGPPLHPRCRCALSPFAARIETIRRELQEAGA